MGNFFTQPGGGGSHKQAGKRRLKPSCTLDDANERLLGELLRVVVGVLSRHEGASIAVQLWPVVVVQRCSLDPSGFAWKEEFTLTRHGVLLLCLLEGWQLHG